MERNCKQFNEYWIMPDCIDALNYKHVSTWKPPLSYSLWHNYKGLFSMILLAVFHAQYFFRLIDVGEYGVTMIVVFLEIPELENQMNVPADQKICEDEMVLP